MSRSFREVEFDNYADGVTLNGKPVVVSKKVVTVCNNFGNEELCHIRCPFYVQCDGGVVNKRTVEV